MSQEMLKSESAGSESAQAMRNDSEVHYGYLSQHHFHAALLNHSHGHCQLQGLSSGLSREAHFLLLKGLNVLNSPYPWSHVAECSWIWHCCEQHCCIQMGQLYLGLSVLFNHTNANVSPSSFPFIFYCKLLAYLNILIFTVLFPAGQFLDCSHLSG